MSKVVLITGINGNLAKKILGFFSKQYTIIGLDIHDHNDVITKDSFELGLHYYIKCDLRNEYSISEAFDILKKKRIFPVVLINNAAIDSVPLSNQRSTGMEVHNFEDIMSVNLKAPIILSNHCINYWIPERIKGNIINISSIYSEVSPDPALYSEGFVKNVFYGASKAALNSITYQLATIFSEHGIRVNGLLLAGVFSDNQDFSFQKKYLQRIPIGRFLEVEEIFDSISLLLSERNSYMTGSIIKVDGGYTSI